MNLVLFASDELGAPLSADDPRVRHVRTVLRRAPGEAFDAGVVDGPIGRAVLDDGADGVRVRFTAGRPPPPLPPVTLVLGMCRPQTARDVLRDATTLGVRAIHVVTTARSDPGYAQSTLWRGDEAARQLRIGAAQAFDTRLPTWSAGRTLAAVLAGLPADGARIALDPYEGAGPLLPVAGEVTVAIGPERGWDAADRATLRAHGFTLVGLGPRVLRVESAVVAALAIIGAGRR